MCRCVCEWVRRYGIAQWRCCHLFWYVSCFCYCDCYCWCWCCLFVSSIYSTKSILISIAPVKQATVALVSLHSVCCIFVLLCVSYNVFMYIYMWRVFGTREWVTQNSGNEQASGSQNVRSLYIYIYVWCVVNFIGVIAHKLNCLSTYFKFDVVRFNGNCIPVIFTRPFHPQSVQSLNGNNQLALNVTEMAENQMNRTKPNQTETNWTL